jgi:hypothetical protein
MSDKTALNIVLLMAAFYLFGLPVILVIVAAFKGKGE